MGCGTGNLLRFLRANFTEVKLRGLEEEASLVTIAQAAASDIPVTKTDYLNAVPDHQYDAVICNFGFDLHRFTPSRTPHSDETIGETTFFPGCSNDFATQFSAYVGSWRAWGTAKAELFLTGRLPNFTYTRAVILAAADHGWQVDLERSQYLRVRGIGGRVENFPVMVFVSKEIDQTQNLVAQAELMFGDAQIRTA